MRILGASTVLVVMLGILDGPLASAGELELAHGLQATTTTWAGDHGGGGSLAVGWWIRPWLGASFVGKEQYAKVDDRFLSYFSLDANTRHTFGPVRLVGALGVVHQHEEARAAVMDQLVQSVFGVGDGIRHRMGARTGVSLALPLHAHARGDYYIALDLDGTVFADADRGPRWMASAGLSVGFTHDFGGRR